VILFVVVPITGLSQNFGAGNDGYIQLARNIVAGDGYVFEKGGPKVFNRPPMYPIFLIPVALFPENLQRYVIIIPQSLLVGFIGMLIFRIAAKLFNPATAKISLLFFLLNPWVHWNAKNPMTAILQTFLYLIFAYLVAKALFEKNNFRPHIYGLFIGLSGVALILSHAAMLPVAVFFISVIFFVSLFKNKDRIATAIISGLIIICLVAPWTYRNWLAFGKFIPVSGGGGLAYFNGNVHWNFMENQPQKKGESYIDASLRILAIDGNEATTTKWKGFKDIGNEEIANVKMADDIKSRPALFIKKTILNAVEYYFPVLTYSFLAVKAKSAEQIALTVFHLGLWICTAFGIYYHRRAGFLLLAAIIFYAVWYFPFATFIGHSLYTLGTIPFLCVLSAAGVVSVVKKIFNL
jgi:4-amino-4-deoxy-L-arabinose transferase-like glycosyltransferase